jgi:hypothetical protein
MIIYGNWDRRLRRWSADDPQILRSVEVAEKNDPQITQIFWLGWWRAIGIAIC